MTSGRCKAEVQSESPRGYQGPGIHTGGRVFGEGEIMAGWVKMTKKLREKDRMGCRMPGQLRHDHTQSLFLRSLAGALWRGVRHLEPSHTVLWYWTVRTLTFTTTAAAYRHNALNHSIFLYRRCLWQRRQFLIARAMSLENHSFLWEAVPLKLSGPQNNSDTQHQLPREWL